MMTTLSAFDTTVQKTHIWINDVAAELHTQDKAKAFQGLRATLHILRDRLPVEEAAQLGAQLPILLAGFYYEGWRPATTPTKERSQADFLERVQTEMNGIGTEFNPDRLARAVFKVLSDRISQGEIEDITQIMPAELRQLWPEEVRA